MLIVNKCDLEPSSDAEEFITDEALNAARSYMKMDDMLKVSALTGENVEEMMDKVARLSLVKKKSPRPCNFL